MRRQQQGHGVLDESVPVRLVVRLAAPGRHPRVLRVHALDRMLQALGDGGRAFPLGVGGDGAVVLPALPERRRDVRGPAVPGLGVGVGLDDGR